MASFLKNVLGGQKEAQQPLANDAGGFADFANAPEPKPASINPSAPTLASSFSTGAASIPSVPYTKWYRVWERTQLQDFYTEAIIIPFILILMTFHFVGLRSNRRKAHDWARHHIPALQFEFATVGTDNKPTVEGEVLDPTKLVKEVKPNEFISYASGRNNVAFIDFKLSLSRRYNPLAYFGEHLIGFIFESMPATPERVEAIAYSFDSKESVLVPRRRDDPEIKSQKSSYDGFVFAVVHKKLLKSLRQDRYDLSLTTTRDHAKLPQWTTVLSENAEITETVLTPELIRAITDAGELFEALIISDQPHERPTKIEETVPRKRISLSLKLPSDSQKYPQTMPLFAQYLRLPDFLVQNGKFRPEALRKVKQTREDEIKRIRKVEEEEQAEERKTKQDKEKKEKREALLKSMSADEQSKYLAREREKEMRKGQKKRTMKA